MHSASTIPNLGSYGRVLQRFDRDARLAHQQRFASYDVNLRGVAAPSVRGSGQAITLFFPVGKESAADRATKVGWLDVTQAWHAALGRKPDPQLERQLSAVEHAVSSMDWNALRAYARERGVDSSGKRPEVEARVLEYHRAQAGG